MSCGLDWNALSARVSIGLILSGGRVKSSVAVVAPTEEGQVSDCEDLFILTITAGLSKCLIVDMMIDVMWSGLECFVCKGLHMLNFEWWEVENLDWNALPARVSTGLTLSGGRVKSSVVAPTEEGQVGDCEDLFILTIAAGLSQCFIVNMMNDVMWSGLECFVCKGLHRMDFEWWEVWIGMLCLQGSPLPGFLSGGRVKSSVVAPTEEGQVGDYSGLECFVCKGLHRLDFEWWEVEKFSCGPY
eukprot:scaffold79666_cov76-Cyclotella_meneghiniana.AAC.2